jgi:hypothetical protein
MQQRMVGRRRKWRLGMAVLVAAIAGLTVLAPVAVSGDNHSNGGLAVVADGLDNPRGLHVDNRGRVVVAEAGRGGETLVEASISGGPGPVCVGMTGSITRINRTGGQQVLRTLPSASDAIDGSCEEAGNEAVGPQGVTGQGSGRQLAYSVGLGGNLTDRAAAEALIDGSEAFGTLDYINRSRMATADLAAFEEVADPDGNGADSNPYGLLRVGRNTTLAADAGGNTLIRTGRNGVRDVVAVFPVLCMPWPFGENPVPIEVNPCADETLFPAQGVPTDVARHRSGDYLVSTLGGFPFQAGHSVVFRIDRGHTGVAVCAVAPAITNEGCEVFADGLTSLVGIDTDRRGNVYVAQFSNGGVFAAGEVPGSVRVLDGGTGDEIGAIEGIPTPGGVAIRRGANQLYVTANSVLAGGGQLLRADTICDVPANCPLYHGGEE